LGWRERDDFNVGDEWEFVDWSQARQFVEPLEQGTKAFDVGAVVRGFLRDGGFGGVR
jgi:hypothetical protein